MELLLEKRPVKGGGGIEKKRQGKSTKRERERERERRDDTEEAKSARLLIDVLEDATTWRDRQGQNIQGNAHPFPQTRRCKMPADTMKQRTWSPLLPARAMSTFTAAFIGLREERINPSGVGTHSYRTRPEPSWMELSTWASSAARTAYRRRDASQFFLVDIINKCIIIIKINRQRRTRSSSRFSSLFSPAPNEFLFLVFSLTD